MKNIAVIGDTLSVRGFKALGLDVFIANSAEQASQIIKKIVTNNYAVIFVTEVLYIQIKNVIDRHTDNPEVAIISIPGSTQNNGIGMSEISECTRRAVGTDILK